MTLAAVRKFPTDNGQVARRRTSSTFAAPRVSPTAACQGAMWIMLMQITASACRIGQFGGNVESTAGRTLVTPSVSATSSTKWLRAMKAG